jgi:hypothetical protein
MNVVWDCWFRSGLTRRFAHMLCAVRFKAVDNWNFSNPAMGRMHAL